MKKRILSLLLCMVLCFSAVCMPAAADRDISSAESMAEDLKMLGLFQGVSETDFALGRAPSRVEALVMLIRVLGKETEALNGAWRHPFRDVPAWADPYVGYAYQNNLTNGVSETEFGSSDATSANYLTFVLRALGYSDAAGADFTWDDPYFLAERLGILPDGVNTEEFWRADVVYISYAALPVAMKGSDETLAQSLIEAGAFTKEQYDLAYNASKLANIGNTGAPQNDKVPEKTDGMLTELSAEEIYKKCSAAVFYIEVYDANGEALGSGSGFFIDDEGTAVTNYHVIEFASSARVTLTGSNKVCNVVGVYDYDKDEDWAVLRVEGSGFSYLNIGAKDSVVPGAAVYAIGSPLGFSDTITQGIISNANRVDDGVSYVQTNAAISSGSSGGALINKYGEVIGITSSSYIYGQNMNLALPMTYVNLDAASKTAVAMDKFAVEIAKKDPVNYLKRWLLQYGIEGAVEYDSIEYPSYDILVGVKDSDDKYCLTYEPASDLLYMEWLNTAERTQDSEWLLTYYINGYSKDAENCVYINYEGGGWGNGITGYAYLSPQNVYTDYALSFEELFKDGGIQTDEAREICMLLLNWMVANFDVIFEYYGLLVRAADLGMTKLDQEPTLYF